MFFQCILVFYSRSPSFPHEYIFPSGKIFSFCISKDVVLPFLLFVFLQVVQPLLIILFLCSHHDLCNLFFRFPLSCEETHFPRLLTSVGTILATHRKNLLFSSRAHRANGKPLAEPEEVHEKVHLSLLRVDLNFYILSLNGQKKNLSRSAEVFTDRRKQQIHTENRQRAVAMISALKKSTLRRRFGTVQGIDNLLKVEQNINDCDKQQGECSVTSDRERERDRKTRNLDNFILHRRKVQW